LYVGFSINRRRKTGDGRWEKKRRCEGEKKTEDRRQKTGDRLQSYSPEASGPSISFKDGRTWGLDLI
jgi:hypothetical protein